MKKLAIHQILKGDLRKYLPSADFEDLVDEVMEVLVEVGLIYVVNDKEKFVHQTYVEWCFNNYLKKHFKDEDCSKFIVDVVLVEENYRIIRSFVNYWIAEYMEEQSYTIYQGVLLANPASEKSPIRVSGEEGNEEIFHFLYSSLTKTESPKTSQDIQTYLTQPNLAFVPYFQNCTDKFQLLQEMQIDLGLDFIKKIFKLQLLHEISKSDKNLLKTLKFLQKTFAQETTCLTEILLLKMGGKSFLHFNGFYLNFLFLLIL
jgi:hypothetical protein